LEKKSKVKQERRGGKSKRGKERGRERLHVYGCKKGDLCDKFARSSEAVVVGIEGPHQRERERERARMIQVLQANDGE
jgi:hypothetical protein